MEAKTRKEKLDYFVKETGAEPEIASHYLEYQNWDVDEAVRGFRAMKIEEERYKSRSREDLANPTVVQRTSSGGSRNGKLSRGFSMANTELVANVRSYIKDHEKSKQESEFEFFEDTPNHSFILPNITQKEKEYIDFLKNDLIDKLTYISLVEAGQLNWWAEKGLCRKLFPLSTVGDGNCLLHAASLGMWGFHDRLLTLREALYRMVMSTTAEKAMKRRWKYAQWQLNMQSGELTYTKEEWEEEWKEIVRLAYHRPRSTNEKPKRRISRQFSLASSPPKKGTDRSLSQESDSFESLEEFHVFVLAHVLRRPIIVVADTMLKDLEGAPLAPIPFRGIYLPLEITPSQCYKYPLVLSYDSGHFAALVPAEGEEQSKDGLRMSSSIPLVDNNVDLLPIHYLIDPGVSWDDVENDSEKRHIPEMAHEEKVGLLTEYLTVIRVSIPEKKESTLAKLTYPKSLSKQSVVEAQLKVKELKGGSLKIKDHHRGDRSPILSRALQSVSNLFISSANGSVIAAKLDLINKPSFYEEMITNYMLHAEKRYKERKTVREANNIASPCVTPGCSMYGTPDTNYMCSTCYKKQRESATLIQQSAKGGVESTIQMPLDLHRTTSNIESRDPSNNQERGRRASDSAHSSQNLQSKPERLVQSHSNLGSKTKPDTTTQWYDVPIQIIDRAQSAPPRAHERTDVTKPLDDLIQWPCESKNCKFFGSEKFGGFCRSCFESQRREGIIDSDML